MFLERLIRPLFIVLIAATAIGFCVFSEETSQKALALALLVGSVLFLVVIVEAVLECLCNLSTTLVKIALYFVALCAIAAVLLHFYPKSPYISRLRMLPGASYLEHYFDSAHRYIMRQGGFNTLASNWLGGFRFDDD